MSKFNSFFNRDFYPTPDSVLDLMMVNFKGETVFEPHGGKGNIIDYAKAHGAKDVLFCEINNDLATICKPKARFIKNDFLKVTAEEISHVTLIVMNPPFSEQEKHIKYAWEIAPDGCQIVSLANQAMTDNYYWDRSDLKHIINNYGNIENLGNCFNQDAERTTDVKVSCIKLYKPIYNDSTNFEGFYTDVEPEYINQDGIIRYNEIQALVNNYIGACKCFDQFSVINENMKTLCSSVGMNEGFSYNLSYGKATANKVDFSKELQRRSWRYIFGKMKLSKYLTSGVMQDVNRFVENQSNIPFTVKNVYRMFEVIVGTAETNFNRALVEAVEKFTMHTHENRYHVPGWKTNSGYMLNKKFIVDWIFEIKDGGKVGCRYSSNGDKMADLIKVLCNLTGTDYESTTDLSAFCRNMDYLRPNEWYSWGFFEIKGFKKGTMHVKFQNEKHWELLNRNYAKQKGFALFEEQPTKEPRKKQDPQTEREPEGEPEFFGVFM